MKVLCIAVARTMGLMLALMTVSNSALAQPYWDSYRPLNAGTFQVLSGTSWYTVGGDMRVAPGTTISCRVEGASDPDTDMYSPDRYGTRSPATEGVTRNWTASGGAFTGATNTLSSNWKAPATPGTYTITFTIDDVNTPIGAGAEGSRDDRPATASITVSVIAPPHRDWKPEPALRPITQSPFQNVASGATATFWVNGAGDSDDYRDWDELANQYGDWIVGAGPDVVNYRWTCSPADAGQFMSATNGATVSWRANSTTVTRAVTLTCTIDDPWTGTQTGVTAPDTGSRNDAPKPVDFRFSVIGVSPTPTPRPIATATPRPTATARPTATPTPRPTTRPTATPTPRPTATARPTATPTARPTATPTGRPTATPTPRPTVTPTARPTATPTPRPTGTPRPTATPTPRPTATPTARPTATPTARPTPVPLGISVSLSSNVSEICAGGIASPVHQAKLVATVRENGVALANRSVRFAWDTPGPSAAFSATVATNAVGQAPITLTSGDEVGSVSVTATCEGKSAPPKTIGIRQAEGELDVDPEELEADGVSPFTLTLPLRLNGKAVDGHTVAWTVSSVEDENGKAVLADSSGNYPSYGHFPSPNPTSMTNAAGNATMQYIVGTRAGTIYFRAFDRTVFLPPGASPVAVQPSIQGLQLIEAAPTQTRPNPDYNDRAKPNASVSLVIYRDGQPINSTPTVLVGQRMNLTVRANRSGITMSEVRWAIGGKTKYQYEPSVNSAKAIDLSPAQLSNPTLNFFWFDGGRVEVKCIAKLNGYLRSKAVAFQVTRPVPVIDTQTTSVNWRQGANASIFFGGVNPGITVTGSLPTAQTFSGQTCWVQIVEPSANRSGYISTPQGKSYWHLPRGQFLDAKSGAWQYPSENGVTSDSPGAAANARLQGKGTERHTLDGLSINESFSMYFMFRPNGSGDQTAWVPLSVVPWNWRGNLDRKNPGSTNYEYMPSGLGNSVRPQAIKAMKFPEWTQRSNLDVTWISGK